MRCGRAERNGREAEATPDVLEVSSKQRDKPIFLRMRPGVTIKTA